jgi:hypothetical protein
MAFPFIDGLLKRNLTKYNSSFIGATEGSYGLGAQDASAAAVGTASRWNGVSRQAG